MKLDLAIPTYNEAAIIGKTITTLAGVLNSDKNLSWKIIVADNGSNDGTAEKVREISIPNVEAFIVSGKGKGRAIREVAAQSQAEYFGFIDADLSAEPTAIFGLLGELSSGADVAIGSRLKDERVVSRGFFRTLSSKIFNFLRKILVGVRVADSQCGLKIMNAEGKKRLLATVESAWFMDLEFLAYAERDKLVIKEIPVKWNEFRYENRKPKLNVLRDGVLAIIAMVRIRGRLAKKYAKRSV